MADLLGRFKEAALSLAQIRTCDLQSSWSEPRGAKFLQEKENWGEPALAERPLEQSRTMSRPSSSVYHGEGRGGNKGVCYWHLELNHSLLCRAELHTVGCPASLVHSSEITRSLGPKDLFQKPQRNRVTVLVGQSKGPVCANSGARLGPWELQKHPEAQAYPQRFRSKESENRSWYILQIPQVGCFCTEIWNKDLSMGRAALLPPGDGREQNSGKH